MFQNKNVAGLWIDHDQALVISTADKKNLGDYSVIQKIGSHHKTSRGGSENKQNHRKSQELSKYFKEVGTYLSDYDVIHVLGPGQAQEEFRNFALKDGHLKSLQFELGTADTHLTDNQIIAKVRDFFK